MQKSTWKSSKMMEAFQMLLNLETDLQKRLELRIGGKWVREGGWVESFRNLFYSYTS